MAKVTVESKDVKENWNIDSEQTDTPQLTISNGEQELQLSFSAESYRNYYKGVGKCSCFCQDGNEYFLTSLSR